MKCQPPTYGLLLGWGDERNSPFVHRANFCLGGQFSARNARRQQSAARVWRQPAESFRMNKQNKTVKKQKYTEEGEIFCIPLFMPKDDWKLKTKLKMNNMYNYLEMKCRHPKMMKALVCMLISLFVGSGTLFAQKKKANTIEEIGKQLSELLINREDISKSPLAINVKRLFPDEDFSKFKDSPAEFILATLYGAQILLPQTWAELLLQADSLGVDKNAKYLQTYYNQRRNDNFVLACVLKQSSKYYVFNSVVLGWKDDKYVMRIYKKMKAYNSKKELEENLFSIVEEEHLEEMKEMEKDFK